MLDTQLQALNTYTLLDQLTPSWPGKLIVSTSLAPDALATPFAALISGGACLAIDSDSAACRAAMRAGACDFVVKTADEALRILKNEIRQRKAVAVGVESSVQFVLDELKERGVLPHLFVDRSGRYEALGPKLTSTGVEEAYAAGRGWLLKSFFCETSASIRALDTRLLLLFPATDSRHSWVKTASRLFPRDRTRHVYVTSEELGILDAGARERLAFR